MAEEKKSIDVFGVQPIAEAIRTVTKGAVDGAAAFFGRICLPAADEFGLLLRDRVAHWRTLNLVNIAQKTEAILEKQGDKENCHVHPRVIAGILDHGSWHDSDDIQQMWSGLLASSCTSDGRDESSLIFISLLGQITTAQTRLLNHICLAADKKLTLDGLMYAEEVMMSPDKLVRIWNDADLHRIDRELDHLRMIGLIHGGFAFTTEETVESMRQLKELQLLTEKIKRKRELSAKRVATPKESKEPQEATVEVPPLRAKVKPTALGLHLFVRCQGHRGSPAEFFGLSGPDG